jgi:glycine cleavage system aminomethyltransferase T
VPVGDVRSGSYGWTLGAAVGLAGVSHEDGVSREWLESGAWEVDVAGALHGARVSLRPPYDPTSARVRA